MLMANFSLYSKIRFLFNVVVPPYLITPKACMKSATCCGMESTRSVGWNPSKTVWNQVAGKREMQPDG